MASVTGLTAERMLDIEASSVISGTIDAAGHLILTTQGGTQIDAGNALIAVPNENVVKILDPGPSGYTDQIDPSIYPHDVSIVYVNDALNQGWTSLGFSGGAVFTIRSPELTEGGNARAVQLYQPQTGYGNEPDIWIRAGIQNYGWTVWRKLATQKYVTDAINARVDPIGIKAQADPNTAYPRGVSMMSMPGSSGETWGMIPNTQYATILNVIDSEFRSFQIAQVEDGYLHFRRFRSDAGGWRPWQKVLTEQRLSSSGYSQGTAFTTYPWGTSFLYLSNTESSVGGWDFSGRFGLVVTFRYSDDYAFQEWHSHESGSGGRPDIWTRTANSSAGWTPWRKQTFGIIAVKDQALAAASITPGLSTHTINLPSGKAMRDTNYNIQFYVTEHNTGTFGSAAFTAVGARPVSTTQFLARVNSSWSSALTGYISYTLTPTQG